MLNEYKRRHKNKYYRNTHKKYLIEERKELHRDKLDLYTKGLDHYKILNILEKKGRIFLRTSESDIMIQCQLCFEYDYHTELYKYNIQELGKTL